MTRLAIVFPFAVLVSAVSGASFVRAEEWEPFLRVGHTDFVGHVEVTPDGSRALTVSYDQTAVLWDVATAKPLRRFPIHRWPSHGTVLTADGKRVFLPGPNQTAVLWDTETGLPVRTLAHAEPVCPVALSSDGRWAVTGVGETAILWDVSAGTKVRTFVPKSRGMVTAVGLSEDGKRVLTASDMGPVTVWEADSGKAVWTSDQQRRMPRVAMSRDGTRVILEDARVATVWDVGKGVAVVKLQNLKRSLNAVALTAGGKQAITGFEDGTTVVWDVESGKQVRVLAGTGRPVRSVWARPDGGRVGTGAEDSSVVIWDARSGDRVVTLAGWHKEGAGGAVAVGEDGTRGLVSVEGKVSLWDVVAAPRVLAAQPGAEQSVALTEDGGRAVTGGFERGETAVWDTASGRRVWTVPDRSGGFGLVAVDRSGARILVESEGGYTSLYDVAKRVRLWQVKGGVGRWVQSLGLTGDGSRALTHSLLEEPHTLEATAGKAVRSFSLKADPVAAAALSRDGRRVLTVGKSGQAVVWDADSGEAASRVQTAGGDDPESALSPDGKRAVVAWRDGRVDVLDAGSAKPRAFQAHTNSCEVALARRGRLLVTGAVDGTVGFWDLDRLVEVGRLVILPGGTEWLVLAPDGRFDASSGGRNVLAYRVKGTNRFFPAADADRKYRTPDLLRKLLADERPK